MRHFPRQFARPAALGAGQPAALRGSTRGAGGRLVALTDFGPNPGELEARLFVPDDPTPGAALVVALHGCTQDAGVYDRGTGWSALAAREGFAVLLPQQTRANNANGCFNWFEPADIARTGGEAGSIAAMIQAAVAAHGLDPARVFVTGLSAGGAMTAVMLATYPELFAAGAIIGGLPYGTATGVAQALGRMRGLGEAPDAQAVALVRDAGAGADRWPAVSLWHGTGDATVAHSNMVALGRQWRGVHALADRPSAVERTPGWQHRAWRGPDGRALVEEWSVAGMGHGVPIDAHDLGVAGPHMLDVGLSSTRVIAAGWGLLAEGGRRRASDGPDDVESAAPSEPRADALAETRPDPRPDARPNGVTDTIDRALRSAGLLR